METAQDDGCSVVSIVHILGKKWTIPVVEELYYSGSGGRHFNGLLASIDGVTVCMLAKALGELRDEGILEKKPVAIGKTLYINYSLTGKGLLLADLIDKSKEFCWTCCPQGDRCRYAARMRSRAQSIEKEPTMVSQTR
jgi:DNA-binding HxlR family transcriptional regulator